ncbi:hypothetical protein IQ227_13620 [Anabaena aphanizomenioides LEGE 00250]|jgi:hypothetical protein|uniref:DUF262 domain-containing protein n=1 Tax=Sphaerospermopsis aphanizomenoides LEGE 00250 TaxID=2777972 RepID=A0ABR9VEW6_9CYAN|nr:hypothetical protein [Sphaerospermopsis aphanizomenoides]MBE9237036.1 hypothetical protein [Sphaerospermopsis aphanizomenoides LEGE 00250]
MKFKFKIIDIQEDTNLNCYSVLTVVSIRDFIDFIQPIHDYKGNLEDQREVLQTRSAKRIRNQMVEDLKKGGILPPIVLGSISKSKINKDNFFRLIENEDNISILDGMQRIQALKESRKNNDINHNLRVEFWFAKDESALLYRMLVLNSGQIPWGLDKQLEVVFKPILKKLKYRIPYLDNLIKQKLYKQSEIVELFLAFASRKVRIDKKQQLAEYHAALDIMSLIREKSAHIIDKFEEIFILMTDIDQLLSEIEDRYVFNNQTVRVGFMVACAEKTFGLLGSNIEQDSAQVEDNFKNIVFKLKKLRSKIQFQDRHKFLALDILKENLLSIPKEKHRQAFLDGFKVIFSEPEINSFAVCWHKMY